MDGNGEILLLGISCDPGTSYMAVTTFLLAPITYYYIRVTIFSLKHRHYKTSHRSNSLK